MSILYDCPNFTTSGDYAFIPILVARCKKVIMIDYVGYNYTCDNQDSLTHEPGYERQKSRALRFIEAYNYLMKNMHEIENESNSDLQFFYQEWKARLIERYNRLSEPLKKDLKADFECTLNN